MGRLAIIWVRRGKREIGKGEEEFTRSKEGGGGKQSDGRKRKEREGLRCWYLRGSW